MITAEQRRDIVTQVPSTVSVWPAELVWQLGRPSLRSEVNELYILGRGNECLHNAVQTPRNLKRFCTTRRPWHKVNNPISPQNPRILPFRVSALAQISTSSSLRPCRPPKGTRKVPPLHSHGSRLVYSVFHGEDHASLSSNVTTGLFGVILRFWCWELDAYNKRELDMLSLGTWSDLGTQRYPESI